MGTGRGNTLTRRARSFLARGDRDAGAHTAVALAEEAARSFGHDYLGTEHLLIGLAGDGQEVAARALRGLGVEAADVRADVERLIGLGSVPTDPERCLGISPRTKKVFALAVKEAVRLRHGFVGTEHLLIAMLREGEGVGVAVLKGRGLSWEVVYGAVLPLLTGVAPPDAPDAPSAPETTTLKGTVVMCRVDDRDLAVLDALIESGIRRTSDATAWLIHAGIEAHTPLLATLRETVEGIHSLRERARTEVQRALGDGPQGEADA